MFPFAISQPECIKDSGSWCENVYRLTKNEWLAASANWLIAKPLRILLILLIALLVRYLARRVIDRMTRGNGGKMPAMLRPLKERAPQLTNGLTAARRAQRAATIGSVLKSTVSFL